MPKAKVDRHYWPEEVKEAGYFKNRTMTNTIVRKIPYEILFKKKPSMNNLRIYGSKVFVKNTRRKT